MLWQGNINTMNTALSAIQCVRSVYNDCLYHFTETRFQTIKEIPILSEISVFN